MQNVFKRILFDIGGGLRYITLAFETKIKGAINNPLYHSSFLCNYQLTVALLAGIYNDF